MNTQTIITKDARHVVVPYDAGLANLVPHAKELDYAGQKFLVLPNDADETKLARNLGINVPSPIMTRYDWRGSKPWEIQKTTAAMLAENERAYVLSTMGCVDADTEYLSPQGWRRIADYQDGEVAQYWPNTGTIEFVIPSEYVRLPCPEMVRFKTSRGVDQLLSPEHRVLYQNRYGTAMVSSAEELEARYYKSPDEYGRLNDRGVLFRTTYRIVGTPGLPLDNAQLRLQVAVNADGHQMPYASGKVSVRVKKPRKIERMQRLLTAANVEYVSGPSGDHIAFRFVPPEPKHAFEHWWGATQAQLEVIADEAAHWDSSLRKANAVHFSTSVKSAADFMQYAFSATGRRTSLACHVRERRGGVEHEWQVNASSGNPLAGLVGVNEDGTYRENVWREPSPDGFKYCFMVPSTFLLLRRNGCIFATGNTGKTRSVLYAADWLMRAGTVKRMLIVAPLSTLSLVWEAEIFKARLGRKARVLHGSRTKRLELLAEGTEICIINHHGVRVIEAELAQAGFDIVVIDELAVVRNKSTELWSAIHTVVSAPSTKFAWGLTGSPTPNEPPDAWGQIKLLTPARTTRTMGGFRDQTMVRVSQFRWVPRKEANDIIFAQMQPSVRFTLDDVMELPPVSYVDREVVLDAQAQKAYDLLVKKMRVMTNEGKSVTAVNEGVLQLKLLQVAGGYIYTDDHTVWSLPNKARLQALDETIAETDRKVIIFVPFLHALDGIAEHLRQQKHNVAVVHGGTPKGQRDTIFNNFQNSSTPRVIVAHPGVMAHGLTLTAANTTIWYSPITSLEIYSQANARICRPGQTSKTVIAHLFGTRIEKQVYYRLRQKEKLQGLLLDLFKTT